MATSHEIYWGEGGGGGDGGGKKRRFRRGGELGEVEMGPVSCSSSGKKGFCTYLFPFTIGCMLRVRYVENACCGRGSPFSGLKLRLLSDEIA